jgi:MFS family permease
MGVDCVPEHDSRTTPRERVGASDGIFGPVHRWMTFTCVLGMSVVAFEGLAVTTIAPLVAGDLGGVSLYGWVFSAFLLAQIVGTVAAGQLVDRRGIAAPFLASLALFGAGLGVSGSAATMSLLVLGRALQGLGAGGLATGAYALVNTQYPDRLRARMVASISSAWVLPALIGPAVAGFVAERFSWRVVFLGLGPLLVLAAAISISAFRRIDATTNGAPSRSSRARLGAAVVLACGTAVLLTGLQTLPSLGSVALAIVGLVAVTPSLRRLMPEGTFAARRGLPAILASRGLFIGGFFCADAFLVLALTSLGGYSVTAAGLGLSAGSLSWTVGSWVHERLDARSTRGRRPTVIVGVGLLLAGTVLLSSPVFVGERPTLVIALGGWLLSGLGIGLAHSTSSTVTFALAPEGREGEVSSSLQLADFFCPGVAIGLGGAFVDIAESSAGGLRLGVALAFSLSILLVTLAFLSSLRVPSGNRRGQFPTPRGRLA